MEHFLWDARISPHFERAAYSLGSSLRYFSELDLFKVEMGASRMSRWACVGRLPTGLAMRQDNRQTAKIHQNNELIHNTMFMGKSQYQRSKNIALRM